MSRYSMNASNFEVSRESFAKTSHHAKVGCPSNWACGEDCFINEDVSSVAAHDLFKKGFAEILPYFRITPMPDLPEGLGKQLD